MVMPPRGLFIVLQKVVHRRFVDVISRIAVFFSLFKCSFLMD